VEDAEKKEVGCASACALSVLLFQLADRARSRPVHFLTRTRTPAPIPQVEVKWEGAKCKAIKSHVTTEAGKLPFKAGDTVFVPKPDPALDTWKGVWWWCLANRVYRSALL
jgi:hypothetical protein